MRGVSQFVQNLRRSRLSPPHLNSAYSSHERLDAQLIEQRLGLFQIGGLESLTEPAIDFSEHGTRRVEVTLFGEQFHKPCSYSERSRLVAGRAEMILMRSPRIV
jgi:hypothetical protein